MNLIKTYFCFALWMECGKTCFDYACAGMEKSFRNTLVLAYYTVRAYLNLFKKISEQV
jgi:hypothetical protein